MPDPTLAYRAVIDSVMASTSPAAGTTESAMAQVIMGAAAPSPFGSIVPFDADRPSAEARAAEARSQSEPSRLATRGRLEAYIDRFGFDRNEQPAIRGRSIREPWLGINAADLDAVIAVEHATGVPAAHVLALWIEEGKEEWHAAFRGTAFSIARPATDFGTESTRQFRAFARSQLLFQLFGADPLIAFKARGGAGGDNVPLGPLAAHDGALRAGLRAIRQKFPERLQRFSDREVADFFTEVGGALVARRIKAPVQPETDHVEIQIGKGSLASWLWLQVMLFESVRLTLEQKLFDLYPGEGAVDLSRRPWATYLFWNTNKEQAAVDRHYGNASSREHAISRRFGSDGVPPDRLDDDQLDRYYSRGRHAPPSGQQGQSTAAWANAIMFRFLVESVEPWFSST